MAMDDMDDVPLAERVRRKIPALAQAHAKATAPAGDGAGVKRKAQGGDEPAKKRPKELSKDPKKVAAGGSDRDAGVAQKAKKKRDKDGDDDDMRALMMPPKKGVRCVALAERCA